MRPPAIRASFVREDELVVVGFAGGGGACVGVERALGRHVDIAINHDAAAIAMHRANHPETEHFQTNIWEVDPVDACKGRPVGFAWFSPDCTFFSKAKGGKPLNKKIRSLPWIVNRWARTVRPRIIAVENVEELQDWGPLDENNRPIKAKKGRTFKAWIAKLRKLGYAVEWRLLVAADYGTPTTRKRLFVVARCDGLPIEWPAPSHGRGRAQPWRTAAEIIDWSLPCRSIFGRERPLKDATLRRIAFGVRRYVIDAARPFIVHTAHADVGKNGSKRWGRGERSIDAPLPTICSGGTDLALISPTLIQTGYGERQGQAPRVPGIEKPLGTVVAGGAKHALVAALLTKHFTGMVGHGVERPIGTITAQDHHALTTATLVPPSGDRRDEVLAFLIKYFGADGRPQGQQLALPLHTVTTKARFGLVTVHGEPYEIADISMRMLAPHELFAAQGFPPGYEISPLFNGKPLTKTEQIAKAGNAVPPQMSEAICRANTRGDLSRAA